MPSLIARYSPFQLHFAQKHIEFAEYAGIIVPIAANLIAGQIAHVPAVIETVWTSDQISTVSQTVLKYQRGAPKGTPASLLW